MKLLLLWRVGFCLSGTTSVHPVCGPFCSLSSCGLGGIRLLPLGPKVLLLPLWPWAHCPPGSFGLQDARAVVGRHEPRKFPDSAACVRHSSLQLVVRCEGWRWPFLCAPVWTHHRAGMSLECVWHTPGVLSAGITCIEIRSLVCVNRREPRVPTSEGYHVHPVNLKSQG